ncbi:MAG TPA: histidine kinase dimerization/phospho-acceptor domain-containing protein, partial [Actinomycetota bacterium]
MPVAFLSVDPGWRVLFANASARIMAGRGLPDIRGRTLWSLFPEAVGTSLQEAGLRAMRDRERSTVEAPNPLRDVWVEAHWHPQDDGGLAVYLLDVTERRRANEVLEHTLADERRARQHLLSVDEMKNEILTAVSHELRTPLTAVLGSALTLERPEVDLTEAERSALLSAITRNARKLQAMLGDLLDLDRLMRGVFRPKLAQTSLSSLVREVVRSWEPASPRPVEIEAPSMVFAVDKAKVERILENLLANADKYSPPRSPIWVRLRRLP